MNRTVYFRLDKTDEQLSVLWLKCKFNNLAVKTQSQNCGAVPLAKMNVLDRAQRNVALHMCRVSSIADWCDASRALAEQQSKPANCLFKTVRVSRVMLLPADSKLALCQCHSVN